jgi:hypothetical protein
VFFDEEQTIEDLDEEELSEEEDEEDTQAKFEELALNDAFSGVSLESTQADE